MDHVRIVAIGFRALGVALAIPALALLVLFGSSLLSLGHPPVFQASHPLDVGKYGLVGLLQNGMIGIAGMFQLIGIVGFWAAVAMSIASLVTLVLALSLFFTGRAIAAHKTWARIAGIVFCVFAIFLDWSFVFSAPRGVAVVIALLIAAMLYAIWTLGWRYAAARY